MNDFDADMKAILSEADASFDGDTIDETGYYKAALGSLRGQGSGMRVMAWGGILLFGTILIVSIWQMFVADTLRMQIILGRLCDPHKFCADCAETLVQHAAKSPRDFSRNQAPAIGRGEPKLSPLYLTSNRCKASRKRDLSR